MPGTVTPRDFRSAVEILGGRQSRKIANNTYLRWTGDPEAPEHSADAVALVVELHGHRIIRYTPEYTELSSCGWHTRTTWDRLSRFTNVRVGGGRPSGVYAYPAREWDGVSVPDWDRGVPFFDGIRVTPDGSRILNARENAEPVKTYSGFDRMRAEGDLPGVNYYGADMGYTRPNVRGSYQKARDL